LSGKLNREAMRRRLAQLFEDARDAGLERELGAAFAELFQPRLVN
jgi:hypothetical protein